MATTYLKSLKVADLRDLASEAELSGYSEMKKAELADALDGHMRKNSTTLATKPNQSEGMREYYGKLRPQSPTKKVAEKVSQMVKSDDEDSPNPLAVAKKSRRKTVAPGEETSKSATRSSTDIVATAKTPVKEVSRRASILAANISPPSPAVVTEAIDQQVRKISTYVSDAYDRTHLTEYLDSARETLSSQYFIHALFFLLEGYGLRQQIMPSKKFTDAPPIPYIKDSKTPIMIPDIFLMLEGDFWSVLSCWLTTSLIMPITVAYFVNLPLKAQATHSYSTRRAATQKNKELAFDPLIFSATKALLTYTMYAFCHNLNAPKDCGFSHWTIGKVNEGVYGGYPGMVITAVISGVVALYEAVLKK